jgi:hypothetical protein
MVRPMGPIHSKRFLAETETTGLAHGYGVNTAAWRLPSPAWCRHHWRHSCRLPVKTSRAKRAGTAFESRRTFF